MIGVHTATEIKAAEQAFMDANPEIDLMQIAAEAIAGRINELAPDGSVLVLAGSGKNGGDGLRAAAILANEGRPVSVWLTAGKARPEAVIPARQAGVRFIAAGAAMRNLAEYALVVDACYGTGGRLGLLPPIARFAAACQDIGVPVLSVDIPSGIAPDEPTVPEECFIADWTMTFIAPKLCHVAHPAAEFCGHVEVVDIGVEMGEASVKQVEEVDVARWWPWPTSLDDKYSRGVVGVDTGSNAYIGAAVMSTMGAVYSGAGMVRFIGPEAASNLILARMPSVVIGDGRVEAWLAGCGWGVQDEERMKKVLNSGKPAVMDAEALDHIPEKLPEGWLMTPHAGELARMIGVERSEVVKDPLTHVRECARRYNTTVLLKGSTQYCCVPDGRITIAVGGPAWTAQAGSGDVLSGICATLLASGLLAPKAGVLAASIQAMTAASMPGPYPPDVLAAAIPATLAKLEKAVPKTLEWV